MAMLTAGGLTPVRDDDGTVSEAFPVGAFQHQKVLTGGTVETLAGLDGVTARSCVKLYPRHVGDLAVAGFFPNKVIAVRRPYEEYVASWDAVWPDRSRNKDRSAVEQAADGVLAGLAVAGVPVLEVAFHNLIDQSAVEAARLADFVGDLDVPAMTAVPTAEHRHFGGDNS